MQIRKATTGDNLAIRELFRDTITHVNTKDYRPEQIAVWSAAWQGEEKWISKINEQHFFVAEEKGQIVGFASITSEGYLDYMYVQKNFQARGIATALLNKLEEVAEQFQLTEIWAHVSITARPFFLSQRFELTKVYITKVGEVEFKDSIMTKQLNALPYCNSTI